MSEHHEKCDCGQEEEEKSESRGYAMQPQARSA
jgi:hypothetical protein